MPSDIPTAEFWTYKLLKQNYGQKTRYIPVQSVPRGALLYHYCKLPSKNPGESDENYKRRLFDIILGQNGVPITWDSEKMVWRICMGSVVSNYQYYYAVPNAGFGVHVFGETFNAAIVGATTRRTKWAYLKSGAMVPNNEISHRRYNIKPDLDRLNECNKITTLNGNCKPGNEYDVCMEPIFQKNSKIDGITAIARTDDLIDIDIARGTISPRKDMLRSTQSWYKTMHEMHTMGYVQNKPIDSALWSMNLAGIETDIKGSTLNIGFREFAIGAFGSNHQDTKRIPPKPLNASYGPYGDQYTVIDEQLNNGTCVKRVFEFKNDQIMLKFYKEYITPYLVIEPMRIITPNGEIEINQSIPMQEPSVYSIAGHPNPSNLRYHLNHNIGRFLSNLPNGIVYDLRLNMFFCRHRDDLLHAQKTRLAIEYAHTGGYTPMNIDNEPPPSTLNSNYMYQVNFTAPNLTIELVKILHELISNRKFSTNWMHEYMFSIPYISLSVPIGPFYNPLSIPITNYDMQIEIYKYIVSKLEEESPTKSNSNNLLHNSDIDIIKQWLNGADSHLKGVWMPDINRTHFQSESSQIGGRTLQESRPFTSVKLKRSSRRSSKQTQRSRSTKQTRRSSKQTHRSRSTKQSRRSSKQTHRSRSTKQTQKLSRSTKQTPRSTKQTQRLSRSTKKRLSISSSQDGGHASSSVVAMDKDTYETLVSLFQTPEISSLYQFPIIESDEDDY